jgi:hypothetical protein
MAQLALVLAEDLMSLHERALVSAAFNELARGPFGSKEGQAMAARVVHEARIAIVHRFLDAVASSVLQEHYAAQRRGG